MNSTLKFIRFSLMALVLLMSCQKNSVNGTTDNSDDTNTVDPDDGVIRILAIGNSFSEDAIENYLYDLAKAGDVKVVIGNLYVGGASLSQHWQFTAVNTRPYEYRKIDQDGNKTNRRNTALNVALADEKWDYISFQQASPYSGQYHTFEAHLPLLFNYVSNRVSSNVNYILHQTWAYSQHSTHDGFANYGRDQLTMYHAIVDAVNRAKDLVAIDVVIPAGTAIQNGRTSTVGDHFTRDGYHLDLGIGRFTAACTWYEALTGKPVIDNPFRPSQISECEANIAKNAAHLAVLKPTEITDMSNHVCETPTP